MLVSVMRLQQDWHNERGGAPEMDVSAKKGLIIVLGQNYHQGVSGKISASGCRMISKPNLRESLFYSQRNVYNVIW